MDPFIGEIRIFCGNFAPKNWALCNGQLLSISQNTALFSLISTNFGGDGRVTFGLPNFQGGTPIGQGAGPGLTPRSVGETGGETGVTLTVQQIPAHAHDFGGSGNQGDVAAPAPGVVLAQSSPGQAYQTNATDNLKPFAPQMLSPSTGPGLPHNNVMPSLAATFIIALQGIFPQRP